MAGLSLTEARHPLNDVKLTSSNRNFDSVFEEICVGKLDIPNPNHIRAFKLRNSLYEDCLLYTSDAADDTINV